MPYSKRVPIATVAGTVQILASEKEIRSPPWPPSKSIYVPMHRPNVFSEAPR